MTAEEFNKLVEERIHSIREVLTQKAKEYASSADRLHNFKRAAKITGETPAEVCVGFMAKHLTSLFDLVDHLKYGNYAKVISLIDEKIGDSVNYLILLEAVMKEECVLKTIEALKENEGK